MSYEALKPHWNGLKRTPLRRNSCLNKVSKMKHRREARFVPVSIGKQVKERSGGICEFVNSKKARCSRLGTCFQHRLKKSQGGKHTLENLRHSCWYHNWWAETELGKIVSPQIGWTILK